MNKNKLNMNDLAQVSGGATPKRKTSQAKTSQRKTAHKKKNPPGLVECPQCHEPRLPHRACPNCGYYDGQEVINED